MIRIRKGERKERKRKEKRKGRTSSDYYYEMALGTLAQSINYLRGGGRWKAQGSIMMGLLKWRSDDC